VVSKGSSIDKPVIRLAVGQGMMERGGLYHCAQSVCAIREGVEGKDKADGFLVSCEEKVAEKAAGQQLIISGLGDGKMCDASLPIGNLGVDAWAGEAPRAGVGQHIFSSWVDGSAESFEMRGPPSDDRQTAAILSWTFSAAPSSDPDLLSLSQFLPIWRPTGRHVIEGGRVEPVEKREARRRFACPPALNVDPQVPQEARQREARRLRLCALSRSAFLLVPSTAAPSAMGEIYDALQMGCVPVILSDTSSDTSSDMRLGALPHPSSVIRLRDFGTMEALGGYLKQLLETGLEAHLAWKRQPDTWSEAFLKSLAEQRGNLACRVCDYLAQQKQAELQKLPSIVGMIDRPAPPSVPTCVAEVLQAGKFWEVEAGGRENRIQGIDQVYVVHYTRLPERRRHIVDLIRKMGIGDALIMASYDREELTQDNIDCFWTPDPGYPMVSGQFSLAIKHFMALYDMLQRGYESILVLEDDVIFHEIRPKG
jgi:hypothetical protein